MSMKRASRVVRLASHLANTIEDLADEIGVSRAAVHDAIVEDYIKSRYRKRLVSDIKVSIAKYAKEWAEARDEAREERGAIDTVRSIAIERFMNEIMEDQ